MRRLLVLPAALAAAACLAGPVSAAFVDTADASSGTLTAGVLGPPTGLATGTSTCEGGLLGLLDVPVVPLTWTRATVLSTSTSPLRGQAVRVQAGGQWRTALTVDPVSADSVSARVYGYVDALGTQRALSPLTAYSFVTRSTWGAWTSADSTAASRTTASCGL